MASPTFGTLDAFTRANGALGANWTAAISTYALPTISSNTVPWPQFASMAWATKFGANQEIFMQIGFGTATQFEIEQFLRLNNLNSGREYGYSVYITARTAATGAAELFRTRDGPNFRASLGLFAGVIPAGDTWFWTQAIGNDIVFYSGTDGVNFTERARWHDEVIKEPGFIAVYHGNNGFSANGVFVDNVGGGGVEYGAVNNQIAASMIPPRVLGPA